MYCPRCATQNLDDAKFCRACGTNLEAVALALSGQHSVAQASKDEARKAETEDTWMEKRLEAVGSIVKASGLLAASLLIGVALGLFSNQKDWIIIWVGLAGWMACWGVISLTSGIHALIESKYMLRRLEKTANGAATTGQLSSADEARMLPDMLAAPGLSSPASVTEQTTEPLVKQRPMSKRAS